MRILGLPFSEQVQRQINIRQSRLAQVNYQPENITVFNSATSFVRLSSAVSVSGSEERLRSLETNLEISQGDISGYNLAKNLVLWGGVNIQNLPGGIGYSLNNSYGFLSDSGQGLKPPPGITSMTTTYKNNGSLKEATVQIKCFTRKQFEAIEAVYLRLGYTMVLEWGHTDYFLNNNTKGSTTAYSILSSLFNNSNVTADSILKQIDKNKRDTSYNYDGLLARVTNFNWTLNSDLSYDITLNLISWGDIIDSLKINTNNNSSGVTSVGIGNPEESDKPISENTLNILNNKSLSTLNSFFFDIHQLLTGEAGLDISEENKEVLEEIERQNKKIPLITEAKNEAINFLNKLLEEIKKYGDARPRIVGSRQRIETTKEEDQQSIDRMKVAINDVLNKISNITKVSEWEKYFSTSPVSTTNFNKVLLISALKSKINEAYNSPTSITSTSFESYISELPEPYNLNVFFD